MSGADDFFEGDQVIPLLEEIGQDVVINGQELKRPVHTASEELLQGEMSAFVGKAIVIQVESWLEGTAIGSPVTALGVDYVIRQRMQVEDGAKLNLFCTVAP